MTNSKTRLGAYSIYSGTTNQTKESRVQEFVCFPNIPVIGKQFDICIQRYLRSFFSFRTSSLLTQKKKQK